MVMVASIGPRGRGALRACHHHTVIHILELQWVMMGIHQSEIHIIYITKRREPTINLDLDNLDPKDRTALPYPAEESGLNRRTTSATAALALCVADLVRVCDAVVTKGGNEALVGRPPWVDCCCCCCCCC